MNAQLWERVQEALDERRDPLADERVRTALLAHPDDALEVCELRASLERLERADIPLRAPRRTRLVPLATAAALVLAALGVWLALRPRALTPAEELAMHPVVHAPQLCTIQEWEVETTLVSPDGTQTVQVSEGRVRIEALAANLPAGVDALEVSSENLVIR